MSEQLEHEQTFLDKMDAAPEDMTLRLIFADWLEEQQDPRFDLLRQLVEFHQEKSNRVDLSNPELLWSTMRVFAPLTDRVETLTRFQERLIPVWRELWSEIGLSHGSTNKQAAEAAVGATYQCSFLSAPQRVLWGASPFDGLKQAYELWRTIKEDETYEKMQKSSPSRANQNALNYSLLALLGHKLFNSLEELFADEIDYPLHCALRESLGDQWPPWTVPGIGRPSFQGTFKAYDASVPSFCYHACGLRPYAEWNGYLLTTLHCGRWWPFASTVIITEKPTELLIEDGKLKRLRYSDGFGIG